MAAGFPRAGRRGSLTEEIAAGFVATQAKRRERRPSPVVLLLARHRWLIQRVAEGLGLGGVAEVEKTLQNRDNFALISRFLGPDGPPTVFFYYQVRVASGVPPGRAVARPGERDRAVARPGG